MGDHGTMNRARLSTYVETQLAPTLRKNVILDNLSSHKSQYAACCKTEAHGSCSAYSPDLVWTPLKEEIGPSRNRQDFRVG